MKDCCDHSHSTKAEDTDRDLTGGANPPETKEEKELAAVMQDIYERLEKDVLSRVDKAMSDQETPVDVPKWTKEMAELSIPILFDPFKRGGDAALRDVPTSAQERSAYQAIVKAFELPEWIEAPEVLEAIKAQAYEFSAEVVGAIEEDVNGIIKTIMAENVGASPAVIKKAITERFAGYLAGSDALRIARTETARSVTLGSISAWDETGVVIAKEWDATNDSCPFCQAMDGQIVELDAPYFEKGRAMTVEFRGRDISMSMGMTVAGPPLHPNCRCALKPVVDV
jgi:hypothetical protein